MGFLTVVGLPEDLPVVERCLSHSDPAVQKAVKVCRFELRQRARG